MDIKTNENMNQNNTNQNNGQKQKRNRRSHKEVAFEKISNHVRIIKKHKKVLKKWTEEINKTQRMISRTVAKLLTCKSDEEKDRLCKQLVKRQATLEKKIEKLERAKLRLAKKQISAKQLYTKLVNRDVFVELQIEHNEITTEFESVSVSDKAYDIEKIVESVDSVLDVCLDITTAPDDDITQKMLADLTKEISETINLIEYEQTEKNLNKLVHLTA